MEETESDTLIGQVVHDNLYIRSKIGAGGMGTVYLAENAGLREKKYAVKVLHRTLTDIPAFRDRFYEEARQQARLSHPNIVQMYDYFQVGDDFFLVLEYVNGPTLADLIDTAGGPLPEKQVLQIIREVLAGLNCAHEHGILHRDVKPPNVLIDQDGRARLTDFGIARELGGAARSEAGMTIGTVEYMSPEQIREPDSVDQRSDVYAAGVVLCEMLTGKLPFDGPTPAAVREAQLARAPPDLRADNPAIHKKLAALVAKALCKNPEERFQGCLEFAKAVDAYAQPPVRLWAVWALAAVLAGGVGYYFFVARPDTLQAVQGHARAAASSYALLCQQLKTLRMKQDGQRLAAEVGDPALASAFARQIAEVRTNMDDFALTYARQITAMAAYDADLVQQALATRPADAEVADRDRYRALTVADYRRVTNGAAPPASRVMAAACPY